MILSQEFSYEFFKIFRYSYSVEQLFLKEYTFFISNYIQTSALKVACIFKAFWIQFDSV